MHKINFVPNIWKLNLKQGNKKKKMLKSIYITHNNIILNKNVFLVLKKHIRLTSFPYDRKNLSVYQFL